MDFNNEGARGRELMETVHGAIDASLGKGSTKNILEHNKKAMTPISGRQTPHRNTQGAPRDMDIDPVKAIEELRYMKATYQQWIQHAATRGQGPEHETVKNWYHLARGVDAQIELWQVALGQSKGGP